MNRRVLISLLVTAVALISFVHSETAPYRNSSGRPYAATRSTEQSDTIKAKDIKTRAKKLAVFPA